MSLATTYTSQIYDRLKYHATWLPHQILQLGDYGTFDGKLFNRIGHITTDFGIDCNCKTIYEGQGEVLQYKSEGVREICLDVEGKPIMGSVPIDAEVTLQISFASEKAIYFKASNPKHNILVDKLQISRRIIELYRDGQWQENYGVISTLVDADAITVFVSEGSDAVIKIGGKASTTEGLDLLNIAAGINITSQTNIGVQILANKHSTPLFNISKLEPRSVLQRLFKQEAKFAFFLTDSNEEINNVPTDNLTGYLDLADIKLEDVYQFIEV